MFIVMYFDNLLNSELEIILFSLIKNKEKV